MCLPPQFFWTIFYHDDDEDDEDDDEEDDECVKLNCHWILPEKTGRNVNTFPKDFSAGLDGCHQVDHALSQAR